MHFYSLFEALCIKSHRRCECNQCGALYVIATGVAYVIKPKMHLTVMTYSLHSKLITSRYRGLQPSLRLG